MTARPKLRHALVASAFLGLAAGATAATPDAGDRRSLLAWYTSDQAFHLTDQGAAQVVDYDEPRDVRVCAATAAHDIGVKVNYDDTSTVVRPGNCTEFDAKRVTVEPAETLPTHISLRGSVITR